MARLELGRAINSRATKSATLIFLKGWGIKESLTHTGSAME